MVFSVLKPIVYVVPMKNIADGLETLPNLIMAQAWKRLTFLYLTGGSMLLIKKLNNLVVKANYYWRT